MAPLIKVLNFQSNQQVKLKARKRFWNKRTRLLWAYLPRPAMARHSPLDGRTKRLDARHLRSHGIVTENNSTNQHPPTLSRSSR